MDALDAVGRARRAASEVADSVLFQTFSPSREAITVWVDDNSEWGARTGVPPGTMVEALTEAVSRQVMVMYATYTAHRPTGTW